MGCAVRNDSSFKVRGGGRMGAGSLKLFKKCCLKDRI